MVPLARLPTACRKAGIQRCRLHGSQCPLWPVCARGRCACTSWAIPTDPAYWVRILGISSVASMSCPSLVPRWRTVHSSLMVTLLVVDWERPCCLSIRAVWSARSFLVAAKLPGTCTASVVSVEFNSHTVTSVGVEPRPLVLIEASFDKCDGHACASDGPEAQQLALRESSSGFYGHTTAGAGQKIQHLTRTGLSRFLTLTWLALDSIQLLASIGTGSALQDNSLTARD